jgi:hypothetical protein
MFLYDGTFGLHGRRFVIILMGVALVGSGCTTLREYVENGFKVGPNYERPQAPLENAWIDAKNPQVKSTPANYADWWRVFGDPILDDLATRYRGRDALPSEPDGYGRIRPHSD